ncbi:MAG: amino acid ABC transporter substrate-binding protein [Clostridia bacterium]|nr:amino acid ABC transporter substrate-binding protein [Clostridia bacterium]
MKKLLSLLLAVLMITALFTGCGSKPAANTEGEVKDTSLEDVKAAGEIIIGLDDTFAPMGFRDEAGKLVGFDVDLAEAVAKELGVTAKFQPIDWSSKEMQLDTDKVDLLWNGLSITDERKQKMMLTDPYLNNKMVIMTNKGSDIKTVADLIGKKIGVQAASYALDLVMANENYEAMKENINEYADYDLALTDLNNGRIEAIIIDEVLGKYKNANLGDKYDFADEDLGPDEYGVGMKLGSDALYAAITEALETVKGNGVAAEISEKWFGDDIIVR